MTLFEQLKKDVRFVEGLKACINCGVCTAICPAAAFNKDYADTIVTTRVHRRSMLASVHHHHYSRCTEVD